MDVSVLVLAKNEQDIIEDCLRQLKFAKQIVVLDQNSTDRTVEIARKFTADILSSQSYDFSLNRNILLKAAKCKWVLYLDCDERLSDQNIEEIKQTLETGNYQAYYFPRRNIILGKWLKHGGWWPDYVPRLFLRDKLVKWKGRVHESPTVDGRFGHMSHPLTHLTASNLNSMLEKTIRWAKVEAELAYEQSHPAVNMTKTTRAIFSEFAKRYFVKMGFLDGTIGLVESIFQSVHRAATLVYLWELQNKTQQKLKKITNV